MGLGRAINPLGADSLAQLLRLIAYGVVSMMLELCSMIGLTLVCSRGRSRGLDVPESVARGEKTRVLCGAKSVPPLIGFGGPSSWDSLDACGEGSLKSVDGEFDSASKVVVKNSKPMVGRGGEGGSISEIINNISENTRSTSRSHFQNTGRSKKGPSGPKIRGAPKLEHCVIKAEELFVAGRLRPTIMDVRQCFGIGQPKAGEVLYRCFERGVLERKGRGYRLLDRESPEYPLDIPSP